MNILKEQINKYFKTLKKDISTIKDLNQCQLTSSRI